MSNVLKIEGSYQEHIILKEVARENFRRVQSRIGTSIVLKIGVSYQEHMTLEEVARNCPPMGGAPDTDVLQVILKEVYLVNEKEQLADVSYSVSGEQNTRGGGTKLPSHGSCS